MSRLSDRLEFLLVDEPPYLARDGGFIKTGAHAPLDELRALRDESRRVIAGLEGQLPPAPAAWPQLKIKHNGVLGYFIEVSQQHADKLMADEGNLPPSPDHGGRGAFFHRRTGHRWPRALPKPPKARWRWKQRCSTK